MKSNLQIDAVIAGKKYLLEFALSAPKSICALIKKPKTAGLKSQTSQVRQFFLENREQPEAESIQDGSTGYLTPAMHEVFNNLPNDQFELILDLGCGNGNARQFAQRLKKKYLGIDLIAPTNSDEFIEASIDDRLSLNLDIDQKKIFLCSHFLCYVKDLKGVFKFLERHSVRNDLIVVIEPNNVIWWETYFSRIHIFLRNVTEIRSQFQAYNWTLTHSSGVFLLSVLGKPLLKTSNILLFRKQ